MRQRHLLFAAASVASLLAVDTAYAQASESEVGEVIVTGTPVRAEL